MRSGWSPTKIWSASTGARCLRCCSDRPAAPGLAGRRAASAAARTQRNRRET
ncbi:hypothetical protein [Lysobacter gummosus]|uniref:hypothetical protein n=1 Tax=Lysobacter gummosus TaxID=262324 RepID=UPI00362E78EB